MRAAIAIGLLVAASSVPGGQEPQAPAVAAGVTPAFEVTSVRPNPIGSPLPYSIRWFPDGRFRATNMTPRRLIFTAIQELGLKLEPTSSPEAGYVIERIERPTPN